MPVACCLLPVRIFCWFWRLFALLVYYFTILGISQGEISNKSLWVTGEGSGGDASGIMAMRVVHKEEQVGSRKLEGASGHGNESCP